MATPVKRQVVAIAASGGNATVNLGAGTTSGDLLVIWHGNDFDTAANLPAPTTSQTVSNKTLQVTADPGTNESHLKVWTAGITVSGAQTVSCAPTAQLEEVFNTTVVIDGSTVNLADFLDGTPAAGTSITNTASHVAPSVTTGTPDALLLCGAMAGTGSATRSYTPASGMTEESDITDGTFTAESVDSQALTSSGATGTKTLTYGGSTHYATASIAIKGAAAASSAPPPQLPPDLLIELIIQAQAASSAPPPVVAGASGVAEASGRVSTAATGVKGGVGAPVAAQRSADSTTVQKKAAGSATASGRVATADVSAKGGAGSAVTSGRAATAGTATKGGAGSAAAVQRDTTATVSRKQSAAATTTSPRTITQGQGGLFVGPNGPATAAVRASTAAVGRRGASGSVLAAARTAAATAGKAARVGAGQAATRAASSAAGIHRGTGAAVAAARAVAEATTSPAVAPRVLAEGAAGSSGSVDSYRTGDAGPAVGSGLGVSGGTDQGRGGASSVE